GRSGAPHDRSSPGTIRGRVIDAESGEGVEGAIVTLDLVTTSEIADRVATTDADGAFSLESVLPGVYLASITHAELVDAGFPQRIKVDDAAEITLSDFRLTRGIDLRGKLVRSDTGAPIANAEIQISPGRRVEWHELYPGGKRDARSSDDGSFVIRGLVEARHVLSIVGRPYVRKRVGPVLVAADADPLEISLDPGFTIAATVLDSEDRPLENARVFIGTAPDRSLLLDVEARTDAEGRCLIEGLLPGFYDVLVEHDDFAMAWAAAVEVGPEKSPRQVKLRLHDGGRVRGRVLDASGRGVSGATVRAVIATGFTDTCSPGVMHLGHVERRTAVSDDDGAFELLHLAGAKYHLFVEKDGVLSKATDLPPWGKGLLAEVDLELP
ncbi:MAG TPA: carboxypeptidase-like regulatory domain-containing protein, partial [Planctomycetota bacterium]|nr:carboxypeptidase-like regulatory domain-containing protein [Planctomycetota bacterium]